MTNDKEEIKKIDLLGYTGNEEIKVGYSNSVDACTAHHANFSIAGYTNDTGTTPDIKPRQLFGALSDFNDGCDITVWKLSEDGVYRLDLEFGVRSEGNILIHKKMSDGSSRRTDVRIVY